MATNINNNFDLDSNNLSNIDKIKFGIVVSNWNKNITDNLYDGAFNTLLKHGANENNIKKLEVPGSFELVYGCKKMQNENLDVIIAIGCVVKGETDHYNFICSSVSKGIMELNLISSIPIIFCVLTDHNKTQSIDRSGGKYGNKGSESAIAAIKMALIK